MASIFEELFSDNHAITESVMLDKKSNKKVTEAKKINYKNIKVESRKIFEETDFDELDQEFAKEVSEENPGEVVLVIDPELPSDQEPAEDAAENMVGDKIYKCPVCGSNYACDCDPSKNESVEVDEDGVPVECPICGDDADQVLIGEIAPIEDAGKPDELDPVDEEDAESDEESTEDEEVAEEESLKKVESIKEDLDADECTDNDPALDLVIPEEDEEKEEAPEVEIKDSTVELHIDNTKLESMMTKVIRENYKGTPSFKVTRCSTSGNNLKIRYYVKEGTKVTEGMMIGKGFDKSSRVMTIKFSDKGAFTESYAKEPSFIVECVMIKNTLKPVSMTYNYKVKVNESLYRVKGKVSK